MEWIGTIEFGDKQSWRDEGSILSQLDEFVLLELLNCLSEDSHL